MVKGFFVPCFEVADLPEYQANAIRAWSKNGGAGLLAMATGAGKTVPALTLASKVAERKSPLVMIVVCLFFNLMTKTDVSLWSLDRSISLDCNVYKKKGISGWLGRERIHAGNFYQLYFYLRNVEERERWESSDRIQLYPAVKVGFKNQYTIEAHTVRGCSVDLDQPSEVVHERLLSALGIVWEVVS